MALDATILRKDGRELGRREDVARALGEVFVGATFGWVPSGAEKLKISRQRGVEFPPELAKHFMAQPATFEGNWSGPDYSVQFYFSDRELIERLEIVLRGTTTNFRAHERILKERLDWDVTFP